MEIEIWSDVVCPWCYIGKRRLEKALAGFEHADDVEIVYRSYQLDPSAPAEPTQTVAEWLGAKYGGGPEAGRRMVDQVEATAAEEGLLFRHHASLRVNTMNAHRLLHLALETGGPEVQVALKESLLSAYFIETENVADHATLLRISTDAGLDETRVRAVLDSDEYAGAVEADIRQAAAFGANGVPFFVIDRKYGVSSAQPADVLAKAWADSHPQLDVVAGTDTCGPDGCAI